MGGRIRRKKRRKRFSDIRREVQEMAEKESTTVGILTGRLRETKACLALEYVHTRQRRKKDIIVQYVPTGKFSKEDIVHDVDIIVTVKKPHETPREVRIAVVSPYAPKDTGRPHDKSVKIIPVGIDSKNKEIVRKMERALSL